LKFENRKGKIKRKKKPPSRAWAKHVFFGPLNLTTPGHFPSLRSPASDSTACKSYVLLQRGPVSVSPSLGYTLWGCHCLVGPRGQPLLASHSSLPCGPGSSVSHAAPECTSFSLTPKSMSCGAPWSHSRAHPSHSPGHCNMGRVSSSFPGRRHLQSRAWRNSSRVRACSVIPIPYGLDGIGKNCERF
jgi:hypothetical protein